MEVGKINHLLSFPSFIIHLVFRILASPTKVSGQTWWRLL